jgi:splicing factor 45
MEMPNQIPEETVRIFVEFSRLECAIKALLDLNGRFFGGMEVNLLNRRI